MENHQRREKTWQGIVKNRAKNGDTYYVKTTVQPILNEKGDVDFKNNPQQFISYRSVNFCSNVVDVVDNVDEKLICEIGKVLTQIDSRHICEIYKKDLPIEVVYLGTDANGDYYTFIEKLEFTKTYNKFTFEFLTENYFFIKTTDWEKYLAKDWSKK